MWTLSFVPASMNQTLLPGGSAGMFNDRMALNPSVLLTLNPTTAETSDSLIGTLAPAVTRGRSTFTLEDNLSDPARPTT